MKTKLSIVALLALLSAAVFVGCSKQTTTDEMPTPPMTNAPATNAPAVP